jgi:hypothetical protein
MTSEEMLHELDAFSGRIAAATTQEIDGIISDARAKLAPCGQSDDDILTRLQEAVMPPTGDMQRRDGQESAGDAPTKENEMRYLAWGKLQELKKH